jgi:hypothetical protein
VSEGASVIDDLVQELALLVSASCCASTHPSVTKSTPRPHPAASSPTSCSLNRLRPRVSSPSSAPAAFSVRLSEHLQRAPPFEIQFRQVIFAYGNTISYGFSLYSDRFQYRSGWSLGCVPSGSEFDPQRPPFLIHFSNLTGGLYPSASAASADPISAPRHRIGPAGQ